jgi:RNA polymerase sigma-70 factor (sigma-E family)
MPVLGGPGKKALETLYREHAQNAMALAYLLVGDAATAEDLVQDAFVAVAGRFQHLRSEEAFYPYFRRAVVNKAMSWWRKHATEQAYLLRQGSAAETAEIPDVATSDYVWRAIATLPPRQLAAVVLRYYEDLSERQASEVLNCSPAALKSLISRALTSLKQNIEVTTDE